MTMAQSWFKEHLVLVLVGQAVALGVALIGLISYTVRQETRIETLEVRGSPHLDKIDNRLATIENQMQENTSRINRIVDTLTRELGKPVR